MEEMQATNEEMRRKEAEYLSRIAELEKESTDTAWSLLGTWQHHLPTSISIYAGFFIDYNYDSYWRLCILLKI